MPATSSTRRAVLAAALAAIPVAQGAPLCSTRSGAHPAALVELYTSQGCSSCPPADRWLSTLKSRVDAGDVVPLALHVGYWDYIGWKDPFAKREFNARQSELAAAAGSRSVYTPGVFLQGREWRQWGGDAALDAALARLARQPAAAQIDLAVNGITAESVQVRATATGGARLFVALTQNGLQTRVTAGENRGESLRNDHVTRAWSGPWPVKPAAATDVKLDLPPDAARESLALVAFVEDKGVVQQALRLPLGACR